MKKLILVAFALSSFSAFAQNCSDLTSTYDLRICYDKMLQNEDAKLNKNYKACMAKLDATAKAKLQKAQRAWIAFRDADCDYQADEMRGGTLETVIGLSCLATETQERAEMLKDCVELR